MTALRLVAPASAEPFEPASAGNDRLLLLKLAELAHHQKAVARIEAEIAPLARIFANARGEWPLPTIARLRRDLVTAPDPGAQPAKVATAPAAGKQPSKVAR